MRVGSGARTPNVGKAGALSVAPAVASLSTLQTKLSRAASQLVAEGFPPGQFRLTVEAGDGAELDLSWGRRRLGVAKLEYDENCDPGRVEVDQLHGIQLVGSVERIRQLQNKGLGSLMYLGLAISAHQRGLLLESGSLNVSSTNAWERLVRNGWAARDDLGFVFRDDVLGDPAFQQAANRLLRRFA